MLVVRNYTPRFQLSVNRFVYEGPHSWSVDLMRFRMIDRILDIQPGVRIVAEKKLQTDEDYLKDHFPLFPVMPGVLMLEAMFQASMWLDRASDDFRHAVVVLKEARNIKFADFVQPGEVLRISAEILKSDSRTRTMKAEGTVDDSVAVSGRLVLERFNRADQNPEFETSDARTRYDIRLEFNRFFPDAA